MKQVRQGGIERKKRGGKEGRLVRKEGRKEDGSAIQTSEGGEEGGKHGEVGGNRIKRK